MKKYKIRCPYCGATTQKWEWWLKFKLIFKNTIYHHCPICHHKSSWLYIFHLRHESTDPSEKQFNRSKLWESRIQ